MSQHLKVLKDAGLVIDRADGHAPRSTSSTPQGVGALRAYFDAFWDKRSTAFKDAVENPTRRS